MKKRVLYLVVAIPLTAVLMGAVTLFIAFSDPDRGVRDAQAPLSKTSWQEGR